MGGKKYSKEVFVYTNNRKVKTMQADSVFPYGPDGCTYPQFVTKK